MFDCEEKAIDSGCFFTVSGIITIPSDDSYYICGVTGNNKNVMMTLPIVTSREPDIEIYAYKNSTFTPGTGTLLTKNNHNHQLDTPSDWGEIRLNPTGLSEGTKFYEDFIAGSEGVAGTTFGGQTRESKQYKFLKNTGYCLEIKNNSSNDGKMIVKISWYEALNNIY